MISAAVDNGTTYWNNPDYFLSVGDGASYPSGSSFAPGGGPAYYETQYIYLGSTALQLSSAGPTITSISPSGGTVGTSGTIHIYGDNLVDPFTGQATAAITRSGVTLSAASATESVADLNDSIATNATTGNQSVTLTTRFGTSNAAPFSIGDPTPVITSISPNSWNAGTSIQVAITGHGFGTNPSLTITAPGVSGYSTGAASDTQIVANVTIAANSPGGAATVEVQSHGYTGSGFFPVNPGQPPQGSNTASVNPIPAPVPQIMFQGANVSGQTVNVIAGQQIALTIGPPPPGLHVSSRTWSGVNAGDAIAGWTPGQQPQIPSPSGESFAFYWVNAGTAGQATYSVTYTWTLDNAQPANSATATFNVRGPANANISPTVGSVELQPINGNSIDPAGAPTMLLTGVQASSGQAGIKFSASATLPSGNTGSYSWVQLIGSDLVHLLWPNGQPGYPSGPLSCTTFSDPAYFQSPDASEPALDNTYPYGLGYNNVYTVTAPNDTATDGPRLAPPIGYTFGEMARSFTAIMYLLWTPTPDRACTGGSTCTIPIPLGSLNWMWTGDAINTLSATQGINNTTYILTGCQTAAAPASGFAAISACPVWKLTVANDRLNCQ